MTLINYKTQTLQRNINFHLKKLFCFYYMSLFANIVRIFYSKIETPGKDRLCLICFIFSDPTTVLSM